MATQLQIIMIQSRNVIHKLLQTQIDFCTNEKRDVSSGCFYMFCTIESQITRLNIFRDWKQNKYHKIIIALVSYRLLESTNKLILKKLCNELTCVILTNNSNTPFRLNTFKLSMFKMFYHIIVKVSISKYMYNILSPQKVKLNEY